MSDSQGQWRWCAKCEGLWFKGNDTTGHCPTGGGHTTAGSGNYILYQGDPPEVGQTNWRWCGKCQGLWFAGNGTPGRCALGGGHSLEGSGDYSLGLDSAQTNPDPSAGAQDAWRWCHKCQGMFFGGHTTAGACPAGDSHSGETSGNYLLFQTAASDAWEPVQLTDSHVVPGPWCPDGATVNTSATISPSPTGALISVSATCVNSCVTDNIEPSVDISVRDLDGNELATLRLDIPTVPARGFNSPTSRSADAEVNVDGVVGDILFQVRSRADTDLGHVILEFIRNVFSQ